MGSESALLQMMLARGVGERTLARILRRLESDDMTIEDLVQPFDLTEYARIGIAREVATEIDAQREKAAVLWESLESQEIRLLPVSSPCYPFKLKRTLGDKAPPVLFVRGSTDILSRPSIAICGSRKASETGVRIAGDIAAAAAGRQVNVVSGYANGIDLAAHEGALECGGVTTLVLAEGILNFRVKPAVEPWAISDRMVIVSEFAPTTKWFATNAMKRNATVCGLSDAVVVVETGLSGGTYDAAKTAIDLGLPLFVVEFAVPPATAEGNSCFLQQGATPIRRAPDGSPNLSALWERVEVESHLQPSLVQATLRLG